MKRNSVRWAIKQANELERFIKQREEDEALALGLEREIYLAEKRRRWRADLDKALNEMDKQPLAVERFMMGQDAWDDIVKDPAFAELPYASGGEPNA